MSDYPLVSIYIPTRNRAGLLKRAVSSVLRQTYPNVEIIIVDDCSTDETAEVCREYSNTHKNIVYIKNDEPWGACVARNRGIRAAGGVFVTGLDDDDELLPNRISVLVREFDPRFSFVCSAYFTWQKRVKKVRSSKLQIGIEDIKLIRNIVGNQALTLRERFLSIGGFDETLTSAQDTDMWMRLILKYGPGKRIARPLYIMHTDHENRLTRSANYFSGYYRFYKKYRHLYTYPERKYMIFRLRIMHEKRLPAIEYIRWLNSIILLAEIPQRIALYARRILNGR